MRRKKPAIPSLAEQDEWYEKEKSSFNWIVEQARFISNRIQPHVTEPPKGFASWLWLRACVTATSLTRMFEPQVFGNARYIDHASIAALTRTLIENVAVCIYLGDTSISQDEWDARRLVMNLNDHINRTVFLEQLGQVFEGEDKVLANLKADLVKNQTFQSLTRDQRGKILNGSNMYLYGRHNALLAFGWGNELTAGVYKYLSSHAHTTAMAFSRTHENQIYEPESHASKFTARFSISFARLALGTGCLHMVSLFPYIEAAFNELSFASLKNDYALPVKQQDHASDGSQTFQ